MYSKKGAYPSWCTATKDMGNKTCRVKAAHEDTRGSSGCFGWVSKALRRKKRGRSPQEPTSTPSASVTVVLDNNDKEVEYEEQNNSPVTVPEIKEVNVTEEECDVNEEQDGPVEACNASTGFEDVGEEQEKEQDGKELELEEPEVVLTWAEEVDDAEQKGLDVFAPLSSCLPHTPSDSPLELTAAAATKISACQRRRARRRAVAAAKTAPAASETAVTLEKPRASGEHEAESAATHSGASVTQRRRARRKALAARLRSEARLASTAEQLPAHDTTNSWPSPSVRVFGSDGCPFETTWEEAAYGAFHAQRHH